MNVSAIMEQFRLDPLSYLDDTNFFEDGNEFIHNLLTEETSKPVTKKNLFSKLMGILKKIWEWIVKQWNRFTSFVRRLVTKKSKTADQILEESLPDLANSAKSKESPASSNNGNSKILSIPFKPETVGGASAVEKIELAYKDLICKIENDTIIFYPDKNKIRAYAQQPENRQFSHEKDYVPANGIPWAAWNGSLMIYALIQRPDMMDLLSNIISQLDTKVWEQGIFNATTFSNDVKRLSNFIFSNHSIDNSFGLKITQINSFNEVLTKLNVSMDFYDDPNINPGGNNPLVVNALNNLARLAYQLQFGITMMTGSMNRVHEIDAKYAGIISDNESLSKFVEGCIKGNIPTKYVAFNAFSICNDEMRGDSDQMAPKMGQTRLALYPRGKSYVNKIALNQYGVRANNAEVMVFNALKKCNKDELIARIESASANKCVIAMEKADTTSFDKNGSECQQAIKHLHSALAQASAEAKLAINITDIHEENIGKRGNQWISIDYGFTERQ